MTLFELYIFSNITLVVGFIVASSIVNVIKRFFAKVSSEQTLNIHYFILLTSLASVYCIKLFPEEEGFSFAGSQKFSSQVQVLKNSITEASYTPIANQFDDVVHIEWGEFFKWAVLAVILLNIGRTFLGALNTQKFIRTGFLYKRIGKISVYLAEKSSSPFAFSFFGRSYISLPIKLLSDAKNFSISSKHELQHIRHKDTLVSYASALLKAVYFFNPAVLWWINRINLEQEFSCDEHVIYKCSVPEQDYKNCLYEVAKLGMGGELNLVGATGFFSGSSRSELIRRIKMMSTEKRRMSKWSLAVVFASAMSLVSLSAYAVHRHAGFGKLDKKDVTDILQESRFSAQFKIDNNPEVRKQLNKMTRTKKGRAQTKWILKNYKKHEDLILKTAARYGLPKEIAAVAFVESGFTNPTQKQSSGYGAGMWQFIYSTATAYGLVVDGKDMRTDVPAATEAAMKYLSSLNLVFNDMRLAVLSYNAGEHAVMKKIQKSNSRDPWNVIDSGLKYDKGYLAKVMAAAIVMKNPDMIK